MSASTLPSTTTESNPKLSIFTSQLPPSSPASAQSHGSSPPPSPLLPSSPTSPSDYDTATEDYDTAAEDHDDPSSTPPSPLLPQTHGIASRPRGRPQRRPPPSSSASGQHYGAQAASTRASSPPPSGSFAPDQTYHTSSVRFRSLSPPFLPQNYHVPPSPFHVTLSAYLAYSQYEVTPGFSTHILWDIRDHPLLDRARLAADPESPGLPPSVLSQMATRPGCEFLDISCDFFLRPWPIRVVAVPRDSDHTSITLASNTNDTKGPGESDMLEPEVPAGEEFLENAITVQDVLIAIYTTLRHRITHDEWDGFSASQKLRVTRKFQQRCKSESGGDDSKHATVRENGVLRVDCLMGHTVFGGLTMSMETDSTGVLSLRRARES